MDVILGCTWLVLHSPEIRWDSCEVLPRTLTRTFTAQVVSTSIENPTPLDSSSIPPDYVAFKDVFSKQAATHLTPHWPWYCAIDLLPGVKVPEG